MGYKNHYKLRINQIYILEIVDKLASQPRFLPNNDLTNELGSKIDICRLHLVAFVIGLVHDKGIIVKGVARLLMQGVEEEKCSVYTDRKNAFQAIFGVELACVKIVRKSKIERVMLSRT